MPSWKRAGWVTCRGDVGDADPPDPARSRRDRAASLRPQFSHFELLRLLAFSAQRTGIRDAGMSARESQTLVNFGPALARRLPRQHAAAQNCATRWASASTPWRWKSRRSNEFDGGRDEEQMVSAIAQADQRGRRGADDTALGRQSGRPSRCSRPLKPNCRCAVPVWRHHIVWRRVNFSSKSLRG